MITIGKLIWDSWNTTHIARHIVIPEEIEEVCHNNPVVQQGKKGRLLIIGLSNNKRPLTAILDPEEEDGIYYPVTARASSKRERKIYTTEKGGEKK